MNEQNPTANMTMNLNLIRDIQDSAEFLAPTKKLRRLSVLLAIEHNPSISQHAIGKLTCLSSAMVNNYVKELQRDNLVSIRGDSNRTQSYHLTPDGKRELKALLALYSAELSLLYGGSRRTAQSGDTCAEEESHGFGT